MMGDSDDEDVLFEPNQNGSSWQNRTLLGGKVKNLDDILNAKYPVGRMKKTLGICGAFLGLGLSISIIGPTLDSLRNHLGTDLQHISLVFTGRGVGYLVGTILSGISFDTFNPLLFMALSLGICAIGMGVAPLCNSLPLLIIMISTVGFAMGALDTGANVLCLKLWKSKAATYLQALHFAFAIGAFLSPLIATPFVQQGLECGNFVNTTAVSPTVMTTVSLMAPNVMSTSPSSALNVSLNSNTVTGLSTVEGSANPIIERRRRGNAKTKSPDKQTTVKGTTTDKTGTTADQIGTTADQNGTTTLKTGTTTVKTGTSIVKTGTTTVQTGTTTIKTGTTTLGTGTTTVKTGTSTVKTGTTTVQTGTTTIKTGTTTLKTGTTTVKTGTSTVQTGTTTVQNVTITVQNGTITVQNGTMTVQNRMIAVQNMTIAVQNATISFQNNTMIVQNGTKTFQNGTKINQHATITVQNGTTTVQKAMITLQNRMIAVQNRTIAVQNATISFQNGTIIVQNGSITVQNDKVTFQNGTVTVLNGTVMVQNAIIKVQNGTLTLPNGTIAVQNRTVTVQNATITVPNGTITVRNNTIIVQNATIKLQNGTIIVQNSTITVQNGTIKVQNGTIVQTGSSTIAPLPSSTTIAPPPSTTIAPPPSTTIAPPPSISKAYTIIAVYLGAMSLLFFYFFWFLPSSASSAMDSSSESQGTQMCPDSFTAQIVAILFFFYLLYVGEEIAFGGFLATFTIRALNFDPCQASMATAWFWGTFAFGRGLAICIATVFTPGTMLLFDILGCLVASLMLCLYGEENGYKFWVGVGLLGLSMASLFPSGIAWLEGYIVVTGRNTAVLITGAVVGEMIVPWSVGTLMSRKGDDVWLMYTVFFVSVVSAILLFFANYLAQQNGLIHQGSKPDRNPAFEILEGFNTAFEMEKKNHKKSTKQMTKPTITLKKKHRE